MSLYIQSEVILLQCRRLIFETNTVLYIVANLLAEPQLSFMLERGVQTISMTLYLCRSVRQQSIVRQILEVQSVRFYGETIASLGTMICCWRTLDIFRQSELLPCLFFAIAVPRLHTERMRINVAY